MLGRLVAADDGAKRFLATTIMSRSGERSGPLYVHAKIGIVDDAWLAIGSANLNEHSLFNDTEVDVVTCDPALARDTRLRLWAEHLERDDVDGDPARIVDEHWRPIATEQLERRRRGEPLTHHLVELPGRVAALAPAARPARRARRGRLEHDGPVAVHEHPVLEVPLHGPRRAPSARCRGRAAPSSPGARGARRARRPAR